MTKNTLEQALGFDIPITVPVMLVLYIAVIMFVGLWAAKKVKNSEDWFVGGRSMGPWITALAHGSSSLGGGMYIAGPQYGWEAGASSLWAAPGDVFGPVLNFGIIARRMRKYTEKSKALTIPEFFGHRYYSKGVRYLSVIILIKERFINSCGRCSTIPYALWRPFNNPGNLNFSHNSHYRCCGINHDSVNGFFTLSLPVFKSFCPCQNIVNMFWIY